LRVAVRLEERGGVADALRAEDDNVRAEALADHAAVREAEDRRGQRGRRADRGPDGEHAAFTRVVRDLAREGAVEGGVDPGAVLWQRDAAVRRGGDPGLGRVALDVVLGEREAAHARAAGPVGVPLELEPD